ncbi:fungal hydrophobin domain-containing protein [Purpureocillium lavendulum]|uniref:Fungal hydrophobin domain-containing protein n=1 Tax=Purpureocillium lavendulum TaxID=1247861 RepID=A0AB34FI12_9HYPO|nr:fungal hydrophobin domain-containing protein [Purpureocillium lavendulum]
MAPNLAELGIPASLRDATSVRRLDDTTYEANLDPAFCVRAVPNGGYVASIFLQVAQAHMTPRGQPDTIAVHWQFLSRTSNGRAVLKVNEVKMGRAMSVLHITLHQTDLVAARPWVDAGSKDPGQVVAYVTNRNMDDEAGVSFRTGWTTLPKPPPPVDLSKVRRGEDPNWVRMETFLTRQLPMLNNLEYYMPRAGHPLPATMDLWIRLASPPTDGGARFVGTSLGYVADAAAPLVVENYRQPRGDGPFPADSFPRDTGFWFPTITMDLDVKKRLPPQGVEWLRLRIATKAIVNGRYDAEQVIFDDKGELIATCHHVAMVVDVARNTAGRGHSAAPNPARGKMTTTTAAAQRKPCTIRWSGRNRQALREEPAKRLCDVSADDDEDKEEDDDGIDDDDDDDDDRRTKEGAGGTAPRTGQTRGIDVCIVAGEPEGQRGEATEESRAAAITIMGGSDEVIVAVVALIVSVVALSATFMQVLQQYYASASGYSQCNEKVMGAWARTKSRRFSWEELRFEVQFDAPVIFVSPPNNRNGPILGAPIFFLDGTPPSMEATHTASAEMDLRKEYHARSVRERIHTADNERASWLSLLYAVQRMEAKSREWQQKRYEERFEQLGPPAPGSGGGSGSNNNININTHTNTNDRNNNDTIINNNNLCEREKREKTQQQGLPPALLPQSPPALRDCHTLTVALQRKRKSWDTMPASVSKPYATTTMCHLIEMMAALGVYWKEFDRRRDRYRGEGNGFMVLGERISDLGLMFSFQVYGECRFEANRVIPVDYIKELCFGYVPTIYRETFDQRRLGAPSDEVENLGSLQMASRREVAETLVVIGCNKNTVQYYLDDASITTHLFPFSFEILGMLSQTFHIKQTYFTYIPNPTSDCWDERSLSLVGTLEAYKEFSAVRLPGASRNEAVYGRIAAHVDTILSHQLHGDAGERLLLLTALHAALDDADEVLTAKVKSGDAPADAPMSHKSSLSRANRAEGTETQKQGRRREMVQDVLRSHIQEVLRLLNDTNDRGGSDTQSLLVPDMSPPSPGNSRYYYQHYHGGGVVGGGAVVVGPPQPRFEDINEEGPEFRQHKFMEVYFHVIRRSVIPRASETANRRASFTGGQEAVGGGGGSMRRRASVAGAPPGFGLRKRGTGGTHASVAVQTDPGTVTPSVAPPGISSATTAPGDKARPSPLEHEILPDEDDDDDDGDEEEVDEEKTAATADGVRSPNENLVEDTDYADALEDHEAAEEEHHVEAALRKRESLADQAVSHDDVWCTLVFRMICWLMLHDFNKQDVQVSKSELLGSRMPVYIA